MTVPCVVSLIKKRVKNKKVMLKGRMLWPNRPFNTTLSFKEKPSFIYRHNLC
jgi:hypothetical protein